MRQILEMYNSPVMNHIRHLLMMFLTKQFFHELIQIVSKKKNHWNLTCFKESSFYHVLMIHFKRDVLHEFYKVILSRTMYKGMYNLDEFQYYFLRIPISFFKKPIFRKPTEWFQRRFFDEFGKTCSLKNVSKTML